MNDATIIETILNKSEISLSSSIIPDGYESRRFYVFVDIKRDGNNLQIPSNYKLSNAGNALKELGIEVDFILTDAHQQDIEAGIRASLLHSFGDTIRNAFLSTDKQTAYIWMVPKGHVSETDLSVIHKKLTVYLDLVGFKLGSIYLTNKENLPTKTVCCRNLRKIAPADLTKLRDTLRAEGFTVPSDSWMSHMADNLRKNGLIVRLHNGSYALSFEGLRALGSSKTRKSPDIFRLLDLARSGY
jgi:hypothetical protein